jgi:hypothetical protein
MRFARVRAGIASQSMNPKTAANNPPMMPAAKVQGVKDDRTDEQPKWQDDQHRVNRMAQQLCSAFHVRTISRVLFMAGISQRLQVLDERNMRRPSLIMRCRSTSR